MARVVVADNDPDALDLVLLDLRLEGHDVYGAAQGTAALDLVAAVRPDVVVLDHRMPPGPTGLSVAQRLHAERPGLPVVLYSNYQDPDLAREAERIGVTLLPKGNIRTLRRLVAASAGT